MSIKSGMPSSHLILCRPLLLLPPVPPRIRVYFNETTLRMRWPKYWSFSFGIIPCKEHPGLISFRMDWLDLLAVQGTPKSLLQHHSSKASILLHSALFIVQLSHPYMTTGKTIALTRWTFVDKVMSLLLNMLSRLVTTFLPRSKRSVQFTSVTQSCLTLCDPMNCSTLGLPVHHHLLEFTQTYVHRVHDAIQPSHPRSSPSPPVPNPSQHHNLFQWVNSSWGSQSTGVSALASFLPKKSQGRSSEWTGWISLQSKGLSRVSSNTTVQKHQFFGAQPSSQSNSHIHTWLLGKP